MLNLSKDVFSSLAEHNVRYVVIGGVAAILHGVPRATIDLDILVEATHENVSSMLAALREAGLGTADLVDADQVLNHEITIFKDYIRLDVQTSTPGLSFAQAWGNRVTMEHQGVQFNVASKSDLIASKRAAGRDVDLQDAELLEKNGE